MSAGIGEILGEAAELEKEYEWLQASELYEQALSMVDGEDYYRRGEFQERIGRCLHMAAFQAESREEFLERMQWAVEAYQKAHRFYEKVEDEKKAAWMLRCRAISKDICHWLAPDPSEKRKLLDECLELEEGALKAFWDLGNKLEYGRTYSELLFVPFNRYNLEWERQVREGIFEKAIAWGEKAVAELFELDDQHETARASCTLNIYVNLFHRWHVADPEKFDQHALKDMERSGKIVELSESVGDAYIVGLTHWIWGWNSVVEESIQHHKKTLDCGEETQDILLKAIANDFLAFSTYWKAHGTEDPDQRIKLADEAMGFYDEAQQHLSVMSYLFRMVGINTAPGGYAEHFFNRARWETVLEKKLEFLERSEKDGMKALKIAEDSDIPTIIDRMCHFLSKTLQARATLEPDVDVKRSLLEKAMKYRERNIEIDGRLHPYDYWNVGVWNHYLALIKMEEADVEPNLNGKRRLLEDAASSMEESLNSINKLKPFYEKRGAAPGFASISRMQDNYVVILTRLYEVTNDPRHLRKAIDVSRMVIESARIVEMIGRIAESYWKIAKAHDILGEHMEATDNFRHASESYVKAAEKMPQLNEFYQDHANYMQAWSEFEKAKQCHAEKKYLLAKEHYERAAELHKSTERWNYISPNYEAWAKLEEAEDLSRKEQTEEAKKDFELAASLFREAGDSIHAKMEGLEDGEMRETAKILVEASEVRRDYCLGRVALEEARILDRQGDHASSSRRYSQAVERFQGVIDSLEQESDRRELQPIVYLCQAWEKMMMAEAQTSPEFYDEAAELFELARKHALDQPTSLLAQAHSSFCRALEAATRFERNRDQTLFSTAKNHIEAASSQYLRAGYKTMSDYTRATSRLLDAYLYTYNAQTETTPNKKAQFYTMAERLLQSSAGAYLKAKHPEKSEEVRRVLESVKEEREIAVSLSEVLHAPTIVSTTSSFSTPTPTHEQAVGLEQFESANIQANLIARRREVGVGEDLDLEIELVNAGKAPAQLVKVEDIIVEGFELKSFPEICRVEDSYLDMKGRTLSPLKTQELKLVLNPLIKGTFELKPRILYLDEAGKYKFHEPEPVSITVQELGIKGWLRGPTR